MKGRKIKIINRKQKMKKLKFKVYKQFRAIIIHKCGLKLHKLIMIVNKKIKFIKVISNLKNFEKLWNNIPL